VPTYYAFGGGCSASSDITYVEILDDQQLTFTQKTNKSLFESPFSAFTALRGNVRTPSMARWKAHDQLYIRYD